MKNYSLPPAHCQTKDNAGKLKTRLFVGFWAENEFSEDVWRLPNAPKRRQDDPKRRQNVLKGLQMATEDAMGTTDFTDFTDG
jgi:hypothetical protein